MKFEDLDTDTETTMKILSAIMKDYAPEESQYTSVEVINKPEQSIMHIVYMKDDVQVRIVNVTYDQFGAKYYVYSMSSVE